MSKEIHRAVLGVDGNEMTDDQIAELVEHLRAWGENDPDPEYFNQDVLIAVLSACRKAAEAIRQVKGDLDSAYRTLNKVSILHIDPYTDDGAISIRKARAFVRGE